MSNEINKCCQVCGDKPSGFNYCGACKLFFYRNSKQIEKFKCHRKDKCLITIKTRKQCNLCRLKRCFSIGMQINPTKALKHKKIDKLTSNQTDKLLENLLKSKLSEHFSETDKMANARQLDANQSIRCSKRKAKHLNSYEQSKIAEIQNALLVFDDETKLPVKGEASELIAGINMPQIYLKKIVKFCKSLSAFTLLSNQEQLTILKSFCCEMMFVRTVFLYDTKRDGFYSFEDGSANNVIFIPWDKCYNFKNQQLVNAIKSLGSALYHHLEDDKTIRDLIIAQLLFKTRKNIQTNVEFLRYNNVLYKVLLRKYFEQKYSSIRRSTNKYYSLNGLLENIEQIKANERILLLREIDSNLIPDHMVEIYSL